MPTNFNKMNVNFNNLRAQAAYAYDRLAKTLNAAIINETEYHHKEDGSFVSGNMLLDTDSIQKDMDDLRQMIITINCVYEPDSEDFKSMIDEIDSTGGVACFNEERE